MLHFDLADHYHAHDSRLHRLDPRAKVVLAFAAILASSLTPPGAWWGFAGLLSLILLASWASGLGVGFTLRRSYLALPFALAALPLPFTVAGVPLFVVPGLDWVASVDGTIRLGSVLLRTWTAVQAAILLTATTPFQDLIWALGALGLPRTLVSTIGFMYRYLFVLADEALRMRRARAARSVRLPGTPRPSLVWQARVAGGMVGSLFLRAIERAERVYAAMLSRGYDGRVRSLHTFRMHARDWAIVGTACVVLAALVSAAHVM
jgi:cobalt/nickel transport system permease protein